MCDRLQKKVLLSPPATYRAYNSQTPKSENSPLRVTGSVDDGGSQWKRTFNHVYDRLLQYCALFTFGFRWEISLVRRAFHKTALTFRLKFSAWGCPSYPLYSLKRCCWYPCFHSIEVATKDHSTSYPPYGEPLGPRNSSGRWLSGETLKLEVEGTKQTFDIGLSCMNRWDFPDIWSKRWKRVFWSGGGGQIYHLMVFVVPRNAGIWSTFKEGGLLKLSSLNLVFFVVLPSFRPPSLSTLSLVCLR